MVTGQLGFGDEAPCCQNAGAGCHGEVPAGLLASLQPALPCPLLSPGKQNLPGAAGAQRRCLEMPTAKGARAVPNQQESTPKAAHPLCGGATCCSHPVATRLCLAIAPHPGDFGVLMGLFVPCWEDAAACMEASLPSLWA